MRIITYQNKKVVDIIKKKGEHKITSKKMMKTFNFFLRPPHVNNPYEEAYDYIINRMKKLISKEDLDDDIIAPIWGWASYKSIRKLNKDNPNAYKITLEIPEDKLLLTDFYLYEDTMVGKLHSVCDSDEEYEEARRREKELGKEETYKLYDRMLNLKEAEYVQATFWKIKKEYVVSIRKVRRKKKKE